MSEIIQTALGKFSKDKFKSLLNIRSTTLGTIRNFLSQAQFKEVTTSSLVNIAGSCENPYASFTLNYYGKEAHLSQSAQLQLEALVIRLKQAVFTVNNSFREENYDDPETTGRRLSEFTLIEPERPYDGLNAQEILQNLIATQEQLIKNILEVLLVANEADLRLLGSNNNFLQSLIHKPFQQITYNQALEILNAKGKKYKFGDDLGISEERTILSYFSQIPTFVTHYPAEIKFFNMKRTDDGKRVYSVDLLTPRLGETSGGAVREEDGNKITQYLLESRISEYIRNNNGDPLAQFSEYLNLFQQERCVPRGGFGIGFERLIGFLLNSTDILDTITYRTMQPK